MTIVMIHVTPSVSIDKLHLDDQQLGSLYRVTLTDEVSEDIADVALDVFHSSVAVKELDHFTFEVKDENGTALSLNDDYESYSKSDLGYVDLVE
ncbi:hypothetical protein RGL65_001348 [Vibrio parahaemolyticus]|nr:hypothetical protein [Vibrio parahaemolyticus]ELA8197366.1 hypothetical protein [Vibrio parahaemolyticus]